MPIAVAIGTGLSTFFGEGAHTDRATAAFNGGVAGLWLGVIGAVSATLTTHVARGTLKGAGASEFVTGITIVGGVLVIGLGLLLEI